MKLNLKNRLALILSIVTLIVTLILSVILIGLSQSDMKNLAEENLSALLASYQEQAESSFVNIAQQLADSLANPLYLDDYDVITDYLRIISGDDRLEKALLLDADGKILNDGSQLFADSGNTSGLTPEQLATVSGGETLIDRLDSTIFVYSPVFLADQLLGIVCISAQTQSTYAAYQAAESEILTASNARVRFYSLVAITTLILLLLASYYAAEKLSAALLGPILKLREHAISLSKGAEHKFTKLNRSDEIGELANAIYTMAGELEMQNQSVKFLAFHDPLTGLLNRSGFQSRLEESMETLNREGQTGTLLFIDIDDFKEVNDSLGHEIGDRALRALSDRLRKTLTGVRPEAQTRHLARIGGDEFALFVAPLDNAAEISILAEEILSSLSSAVVVEKELIHTSASIGIANFPDDGETPSTLLNNADAAMYTSKHLGKGTYRFYEPEMNNARFRSSTIKIEFQQALASDDQLELLFQPIINMSTGQIAAAEALIRWNHPRLGYLSPEQFIAIVEHNEVALPTDLWVLNKSLGLLEDLCAAEMPEINISVNVSASNLLRKQFPAAVRKVTKNRENLAHRIKLEITETFLHSDDDQVRGTMKKLRDMGFRIWLDDFGTGYSSLRHLKDFPVDGIKIDQIFIANLMESDNDRNMVTALMALAKAFSVEVVAEGIDRQDSLETLKKWGVEYGQGMVIGEPISALELVKKLGEIDR